MMDEGGRVCGCCSLSARRRGCSFEFRLVDAAEGQTPDHVTLHPWIHVSHSHSFNYIDRLQDVSCGVSISPTCVVGVRTLAEFRLHTPSIGDLSITY